MLSQGEAHYKAKLTAKQVLEIYHSLERMEDDAVKYGVSANAIGCIKAGRSWVSVTKHNRALPSVHKKRLPEKREITFDVDENGCHNCTSHALSVHGYPKYENGNLHRFLFQEAFGKLPSETVVRHRCDNRQCINLEHLLPGTAGDNARDRTERGRTAKPLAKLSPEDVASIYCSTLTIAELARKYNVVETAINKIRVGDIWRDVTKDLGDSKISVIARFRKSSVNWQKKRAF